MEPACEQETWLCGNFGPVGPVEELSTQELKVEGALPPSLNGLYLRNGPNPSSGSSPHWFSGDGMVHGLGLAAGKAEWFRSRYVQTDVLGAPPIMGQPCFIFHGLNAYESASEPGTLILDAVRYEKMWVDGPSDFSHPSELTRFSIDLNAGRITRQTLDDRRMEFPRIDPRRVGVENRYGYALLIPGAAVEGAKGITKLDFQTGKSASYEFPGGLLFSEATLVPDSPSAAEDEGWLLSYVYDGNTAKSRLAVFDATEIERARSRRFIFQRVSPTGFTAISSPAEPSSSIGARFYDTAIAG